MLDRTYCASPDCTNECGRKLPEELKGSERVWLAYFCNQQEGKTNDET